MSEREHETVRRDCASIPCFIPSQCPLRIELLQMLQFLTVGQHVCYIIRWQEWTTPLRSSINIESPLVETARDSKLHRRESVSKHRSESRQGIADLREMLC